MRWIVAPGWPGHLLAFLAGASMTLALAPFDLWPLALLSLALFYAGLRQLAPRAALWRGWWYGLGTYLTGISWIYVSIHDYGEAPPLLAGFLTLSFCMAIAFFFGLPAWLWARWLRPAQAPISAALGFAGLWFVLEVFRGWFLTGFPWLYAGYSQLDGPLASLAPLGGVWLIGFCLMLSAALTVELLSLRRPLHWALAALLVFSPWLVATLLAEHSWTHAKGQPLSVVAVQGNVAQQMKWDPQHLEQQLDLYRQMSFASPRADLLIWPETAVPIPKDYVQGYLDVLGRFAQKRDSALITGVPIRLIDDSGRRRYYNGLTVVGEGRGDYLKQKLVPFGEYVPLQDVLRGLIAFFDLPMSDFARGPADQPLLEAKGLKIAPFICYEVVYPEFVAAQAKRSDVLLTVSNDTWFGTSLGPLQHLQMAQMRALEAGRWMIRATNNGVTTLIDPRGQLHGELPQFTQALLQGTVQPMQGLTPYLRWGSWPLALLSAALLGLTWWSRRYATSH